MEEIAAVAVVAVPLAEEADALFGLVETVLLIVLAQLVAAVGEAAAVAVGAVAELDVLFAELGLLLGTQGTAGRRGVSGEAVLLGQGQERLRLLSAVH
jgi:hypothetical protein